MILKCVVQSLFYDTHMNLQNALTFTQKKTFEIQNTFFKITFYPKHNFQHFYLVLMKTNRLHD